MAKPKNTSNVIDFQREKARRRPARPFQGSLLKAVAASMDTYTRAGFVRAVAEGVQNGTPTMDIVRAVKRDQVRAAARAAL